MTTVKTPSDAVRVLRYLIAVVPGRLAALSSERAAESVEPQAWAPGEELGHLIDSAFNNHRRIILAQLEVNPDLSEYDGDGWVRLNGYRRREWLDLIRIWQAANEQLVAAAEGIAEPDWELTCRIGGSEPLTLGFIVIDYVSHMLHHLGHLGLPVEELQSRALKTGDTYPEKSAPVQHRINEFLRRRWSPRLFEQGRAVEREKILSLLEAVRWAPSCFNEQPWRYLVFDGTDEAALERARGCLSEGNSWARNAPVLMLSVAKPDFERNGKPNRHAQHDVGLASENLVVQAVELGLIAHQMAGFDSQRARVEFGIPEDCTPMAMIAIGFPYTGDLADAPEKLGEKERAGRGRKPIGEIAFAGEWARPYHPEAGAGG